MNIVMCTLVQRWVHCIGDSTETVEVTQLCPYGMKVFARKLLEHPKWARSKTRKTRKARKHRKSVSEFFSSEFSI